jgi:hypothetical protein
MAKKSPIYELNYLFQRPHALVLHCGSSAILLPRKKPRFITFPSPHVIFAMARPSLIKASRDAIKDNPKEIFNFYLIACTCIWSFSGVAKGFDEGMLLIALPPRMPQASDQKAGNIASAVIMDVFKKDFGIENETEKEYASTKGWIVAIATAGAVFGCLACIWLTQRLGRKLTYQLFTLVYIAGVLGQTFSKGNLGALYATRVIAGLGIGTTTVLPPIYIAEVRTDALILKLSVSDCNRLPPSLSEDSSHCNIHVASSWVLY